MVFVASDDFVKNTDGFGVPRFGGAIACMYNTVAYTDTTAKTLFTLPAGAVVVGVKVVITTAFDGTTPVLDIGRGSTANYFANDLDASSAGALLDDATGMNEKLFETALTAETPVTATFAVAEGTPSQGAAAVAVFYVLM